MLIPSTRQRSCNANQRRLAGGTSSHERGVDPFLSARGRSATPLYFFSPELSLSFLPHNVKNSSDQGCQDARSRELPLSETTSWRTNRRDARTAYSGHSDTLLKRSKQQRDRNRRWWHPSLHGRNSRGISGSAHIRCWREFYSMVGIYYIHLSSGHSTIEIRLDC